MKAIKYILISIFSILILGFAIMFIIWASYPKKKINLFVLDKTVKDFEYLQHKSLFWTLNNERFVMQNGSNYSIENDYNGFVPLDNKEYKIKRISLEQIDSLSTTYDALYYTDAYGVYFDEWFRGFKEGLNGVKSFIDGGLNQNDYLFLKAMKDKKKLIIGEYNILEYPTSEVVRYKTEQLFGVRSTGWVGRYYELLDSTKKIVPKWIIDIYKANNANQWPFKKSGLVFYNSGNIFVLEMGKQLKSDKIIIVSSDKLKKLYGLPKCINYYNWFEVVEPADTNKILANYQLNLTKNGDSIVLSHNLKAAFPAIIANFNNNNKIYYFAGDFADNYVHKYFSRLANSRSWLRKLTLNDSKLFFYNYYFLLVNGILNNYSSNIKN